jgi:hypothetical protein
MGKVLCTILVSSSLVCLLAPVPGLVVIANALYRMALWEDDELAPTPGATRDSEPSVVDGGYR